MDTKKVLLKSIKALIKDGEKVLVDASFERGYSFDYTGFTKLRTGGKNILRILGEAGQAWQEAFAKEPYNGNKEDEMGEYGARYDYLIVVELIGALQSLKDAVQQDLIFKIESLAAFDIFGDLLDQADYLFASGAFLAAGVVGRAVLEEHLRKWSQKAGCIPTKPKPTISDFITSLYPKYMNKLVMKQADALAAIGNDAAHNKPSLRKDDVERLLRELRGFLAANAAQ